MGWTEAPAVRRKPPANGHSPTLPPPRHVSTLPELPDPFGELIIYARGAVSKGAAEGLEAQSDALAQRWKDVATETGQDFYEAYYDNPWCYRDTGQVDKLADKVVEHIMAADPNEPIFIIGHSTGGAVVVRALEKLLAKTAKMKPNQRRRVSMVFLCDATVSRSHPGLAETLAGTSDETIILRSTKNAAIMWLASTFGDAITGKGGRNLGQPPDPKQGELRAPKGSDSDIREATIKGTHVELLFKDVPASSKDYMDIKERADRYLNYWLTNKYFPSEWGRTHYQEARAQRGARERMKSKTYGDGRIVYPAH